jgi:nicotinamidase-related amidase
MKRSIHALIIDPQNDFCDLPDDYLPPVTAASGGERASPQLPVAGAHADMLRLSEMLRAGMRGIGGISVTLDSHRLVGIERPAFWMTGAGDAVAPFTQITARSVRARAFVPRASTALPRVLSYLDTLEAAGRYTLMVWTPHCVTGSWGHAVHADVRRACTQWEERELGLVNEVSKGTNPWTEHYSALQAEVPDPDDPATQLNRELVQVLADADHILVAGEAGSHCVLATVEHVADTLRADSLSKITLLTDAMSPVAGFETQYRDFLQRMAGRGMQLATTGDVLPELIANGRR